ncbi:MAG: hypothetical protein IT324_18610 [Anaerolineae bacterium]|nr:hypothetical protein [Anaerolineae bacterium]
MITVAELLDYIFDGATPAFYPEFEGWLRSSRRFKAFAMRYRGKLRAKLKNVRDENGMKDLRAELDTAVLLLREERFTLDYETYAASKQRGPDFTVTFKTHTPFNVEVRRIRSVELDDKDSETPTGKLMAVLCDKVGQMPPGIVNLLWLVAERAITLTDLNDAGTTLRQLVERKAEDFFARRGFESAAHFHRQYRQLSGVVVHQPHAHVLWLNALSRHQTPPEIVTAIQRIARS